MWHVTLKCRALAWVGILLLAGCASVPTEVPTLSSSLPRQVELTRVPFYPQEDYQCGPAALATALGDAGIVRSPQSLVADVYVPQRQGSLPAEMLAATRRAGALPYLLAPTLDDMLREVAAGHPVVVLQNLRWHVWPQWHYAVVSGYDLTQRSMLLRSGTEARLTMTMPDFEDSWQKAQRWAFVALPVDELPATAREPAYVQAAVDLERVSPALAQRAYATALRAWPDSEMARIGLGNAYYKMGRLGDAGQAYRQVTQDHPQSADAWNNLAQVLFEQGQISEAKDAAQQAVTIGGVRLEIYRTTLTHIEQRLPPDALTPFRTPNRR